MCYSGQGYSLAMQRKLVKWNLGEEHSPPKKQLVQRLNAEAVLASLGNSEEASGQNRMSEWESRELVREDCRPRSVCFSLGEMGSHC